jgi:hypothetical protein
MRYLFKTIARWTRVWKNAPVWGSSLTMALFAFNLFCSFFIIFIPPLPMNMTIAVIIVGWILALVSGLMWLDNRLRWDRIDKMKKQASLDQNL